MLRAQIFYDIHDIMHVNVSVKTNFSSIVGVLFGGMEWNVKLSNGVEWNGS